MADSLQTHTSTQTTLADIAPGFPTARRDSRHARPQAQRSARAGGREHRSSAPCSALPTVSRMSTPFASPRRPSAASMMEPPRASSTPSPSIQPPRSSQRSRSTRSLAARLLTGDHHQGSSRAESAQLFAVHRLWPRGRRSWQGNGGLRRSRTHVSSTTPSTTNSPIASNTSACVRSTTATCCATRSRAASSRRRSISSCVSRAVLQSPHMKPSTSTASSPRSTTCPRRRRCSTPAPSIRRCPRATCTTSPGDSLDSIYDTYKNVALLSKFSGGIGLAFHRVRSEGSLIRATNGLEQRHHPLAAHAR